MEWEGAFEMVSPQFSALWASANVRVASLSWAHWREQRSNIRPSLLVGWGFLCCFFSFFLE